MNTRQAVLDALAIANIPDSTAQALAQSVRRSLKLNPTSVKSLSAAASKFGGLPDAPDSFAWPISSAAANSRILNYEPCQYVPGPHRFIAQINLSHLPFIPDGLALPKFGMLYFFAATQKFAFPFTECTGKDWSVLYHAGDGAECRPFSPPESSEEFRRVNAEFSDVALAPDGSVLLPEFHIEFEEWHSLDPALVYSLPQQSRDALIRHPKHLIGGYPDYRQTPVEETAAYYSNKVTGSPISEWKMLAQFDSDRRTKLAWAAEGCGYFMTPSTSGGTLNADDIVLVTQST